MPSPLYRINHSLIMLHDVFMASIAWFLAVIMRYNWTLTANDEYSVWQTLPMVILVQLLLFWQSGLYRGIWRFTSMPDFTTILRIAILSTLLIAMLLILINRLEGVPRGSLLIYPFLLILLLGLPRLLVRLWYERTLPATAASMSKRVLVLGAGTSGDMLVRDMLRHTESGYIPVGFLDDNKRLHGSRVQGVPILGTIESLESQVEMLEVDLIVIAMPAATSKQMQRIVERCERSAADFLTLPKLDELVQSPVNLNALRDVSINDLLGRERVELDWQAIADGVCNKTVMVSGGGGSIGGELCQQIARLNPQALVIFEHSEFNLYQVEQRLRARYPALRLYACLGDVTDRIAIHDVLQRYQPQMIFHAAAYKHVPMLQHQIRAAVRNNILGTRILATTAAAQGCGKFVLISTDKAVNPANIMGATKRAAEVFCQALNVQSNTHFITVRFGNVLGSAGSVVPLFQSQIAGGGPLTVTHPDISRYFMTIPEACQLILQAGSMGQGGEIFVLDMGTPIRIRYLAEQMIRLAGKVPDQDIDIVYTGLRPGEKLHEELFHTEEHYGLTAHSKIFLAAHHSLPELDQLEPLLTRMATACDHCDTHSLHHLLAELVPGWCGEISEN